MQPRAYRCRTASDHFRDFLCAVALHIVQPHRDSLIVRQCVYRLPQLAQQPCFQMLGVAEIGVVPQQPEKDFLIDVLCVRAAVQSAQS